MGRNIFQRHFGENYAKELSEKSADPIILEKCPDIKWHFIGTVQSSNISKIVKSPNLTVVETISNLKQADKFQSSCKSNKVNGLGVMVQVSYFQTTYLCIKVPCAVTPLVAQTLQ